MTIYITNYACSGWTAYREVGYGHQMKDQLTALLIANIFGYTYVNQFHKPIASMGLHQETMKLSDLPGDIPRIVIEKTGVRNGMSYNRLEKLLINIEEIEGVRLPGNRRKNDIQKSRDLGLLVPSDFIDPQ